jgi:hypothetical protein
LCVYLIYSGEKLQRIGKDGGKLVCRDGLEGRNPQEEEKDT